ncbi:MAG: hypothetical protein LBH85_03275 [Treponema sp.]|nr:hypothetical protein [Treponema sp.]
MIYLSNFAMAGKDSRAVSIAAITPRGFKGAVRKDLAPPFSLVKAYKDEKITEAEYILEYGKRIYALDLERIAEELDEKILLCYCDKNAMCHRTLLGLFLHTELGVEVEEIGGFGELFTVPFNEVENPMTLFLTPEQIEKHGLQDLETNDIIGKWKELKKRNLLNLFFPKE